MPENDPTLDFDTSDEQNEKPPAPKIESECPLCGAVINHKGASAHMSSHGVDYENVTVDPTGITVNDDGWKQYQQNQDSPSQDSRPSGSEELTVSDLPDWVSELDEDRQQELLDKQYETLATKLDKEKEDTERQMVRVRENADQIDAIEDRLDSIEEQEPDVPVSEERIEVIESRMADIDDAIDAIESLQSAHNDRLISVEEASQGNANAIQSIQSDLAEHSMKISTLETAVKKLRDSIPSDSGDLGAVAPRLDQARDRLF